jgi:hypothetical protein
MLTEKELWEKCKKGGPITAEDLGLLNMRDATLEEQQHVQEQINKISKPTGINFYDFYEDSSSPCDKCANNPKNGGSGVCWCTLGTPKITC